MVQASVLTKSRSDSAKFQKAGAEIFSRSFPAKMPSLQLCSYHFVHGWSLSFISMQFLVFMIFKELKMFFPLKNGFSIKKKTNEKETTSLIFLQEKHGAFLHLWTWRETPRHISFRKNKRYLQKNRCWSQNPGPNSSWTSTPIQMEPTASLAWRWGVELYLCNFFKCSQLSQR